MDRVKSNFCSHIPLIGCVIDVLFQLFTSDSTDAGEEIVDTENVSAQKNFRQLQCIKLS